MKTNLKPVDPLSHAVFGHDYLQLVFQHETFTIYNDAEFQVEEISLRTGEPGFCDALVGAIGQRIVSASYSESGNVVLVFAGGSRFAVRTDSSAVRGPEAWQFNSPGKPPVVQQNV